MAASNFRRHRGIDIWPGFVDALATLIMVIVFVLMVFTVFQFHLKDLILAREMTIAERDRALVQRDTQIKEQSDEIRQQNDALAKLTTQLNELANVLSMERQGAADLRTQVTQLTQDIQVSVGVRERLQQELAAVSTRADLATQAAQRSAAELEDAFKTISADREKIDVQLRELDGLRRNIETLTALRREMEQKLSEQAALTQRGQDALASQTRLTEDAQLRIDLLTRQLAAVRDQIDRLNAALEASEARRKSGEVQIADLGSRLNLALANRVEELARYRSEFFGRLREVLGQRADVREVGDRFVFQSEVLFPAGSAELQPAGRTQLEQLATTLQQIAPSIPNELNWVLQVDGHTDKRPIATREFPSNWELSSARAISVVKFLASRGIPYERLSATGFGEFQPVDPRENDEAYRRNRRIELKFTNR
jgi:chemotaxis protein MotB